MDVSANFKKMAELIKQGKYKHIGTSRHGSPGTEVPPIALDLFSGLDFSEGYQKVSKAVKRLFGKALQKIAESKREDPSTNQIKFSIECTTTGKLIRLEANYHHTINEVLETVAKEMGISSVGERTNTLVLNGVELPSSITMEVAMQKYGLKDNDQLTLWAKVIGSATFNEHQKLIRDTAKVFMHRLFQELPKKVIVEVLVDNGVHITYNQVVNKRIPRDQLLNMIESNGLSHALEDKVYQLKSKRWTWASRLYSILKNIRDAYYFQGKEGEIFWDRFSTPPSKNIFSSLIIEKLIDLVSRVNDADIDINTRLIYIKNLNEYAKRFVPEFKTYDLVQNKPYWILAKALQRVISDERNRYISLTELAREVFEHDHAFGFAKEGEPITNNLRGSLPKTFPNFQRIIDYSKNQITDYTRRHYIYGLIEAVAYASDMVIITPDNPKNIELKLLGVMRDVLIECGVFGDSITLTDINNYFNIKVISIYFGNYELFLKTFTDDQLQIIYHMTKSQLMKINPNSANKLLSELSRYRPSIRASELLRMAPNEIEYNNLLHKISHGDSSTVHDSNWPSMRDGIIGRQVANLQSFSRIEVDKSGKKITVEYMFDGYTGKIYRANEKYSSGRSIWELHHIDFDKTNNNPDNLIWVVKAIDPATGKSSHQTNLPDNELRQYIAEMRLIKIALKYGYAPNSWEIERQLEYIRVQQSQESQYIIP